MSKYTFDSLYSPGDTVTEAVHESELNLLSHKRLMDAIDRQAARRNFLTGLGAAGIAAGTASAASMLSGCTGGGAVQSVSTSSTSNPLLDTLNFALNLEYFEASFYTYVATGSGIPTSIQGSSPGTVTGGAQIAFTIPEVADAATQLSANEQAHVSLLQQTITGLGGSPVSMPNINLNPNNTPITTDALFLAYARLFEGVGVSAYAGGAANLVSNPNVVTAAAQILHLEAQHEGFLRLLCIANNVTSPAADSLDIPPTISAVFNTNPSTGLGPVRTTSQVLQIVYATTNTGVTSGGYFPNGLNGNIKST